MTASHLPYTRNGLKFFTRKGGLTSPEVEEICDKAARKYANRLTKVSTMLNGTPTRVDFMSTYAKHLRDIIKERVNHPLHYDTPLKGFQVSRLTYLISWDRCLLFVFFLHCFMGYRSRDGVCAYINISVIPENCTSTTCNVVTTLHQNCEYPNSCKPVANLNPIDLLATRSGEWNMLHLGFEIFPPSRRFCPFLQPFSLLPS